MADPEPYNAADPEQVKTRGRKVNKAREREQHDLRAVLSTLEGKRFVWRVMSVCGIHSDSFHTNALQMANNEGRRKIGLFLELEIAETCPEKFMEMQILASKEETNG